VESFRRREVEKGGSIVPASHPNRTSGRTGITSASSRKVGNAPMLHFLTFKADVKPLENWLFQRVDAKNHVNFAENLRNPVRVDCPSFQN
jgi:hypothetical protein